MRIQQHMTISLSTDLHCIFNTTLGGHEAQTSHVRQCFTIRHLLNPNFGVNDHPITIDSNCMIQ